MAPAANPWQISGALTGLILLMTLHWVSYVQVQFSLISRGPQQQDIKDVCKALGIGLIAYSPLGLGMLTGKYSVSAGVLPKGPRGALFRQILPGLEPLLGTMEAIARDRSKSVSQVSLDPEHCMGFGQACEDDGWPLARCCR